MKKIVAVFLVLSFIFALAACGTEETHGTAVDDSAAGGTAGTDSLPGSAVLFLIYIFKRLNNGLPYDILNVSMI